MLARALAPPPDVCARLRLPRPIRLVAATSVLIVVPSTAARARVPCVGVMMPTLVLVKSTAGVVVPTLVLMKSVKPVADPSRSDSLEPLIYSPSGYDHQLRLLVLWASPARDAACRRLAARRASAPS